VSALLGAGVRLVKDAEELKQEVGAFTFDDIVAELEKPGRDPRPEFRTAAFKDGVHEIRDLLPGMLLEGVVTNVANFGAFVDIGVHQDGLVHVSQLTDRFVKDPREVVKAGDIVKVKVVEVDLQRRRIALTMKLHEPAGGTRTSVAPEAGRPTTTEQLGRRQPAQTQGARPPQPSTSMGAAFAKLSRPD